MYHTVRWTLFTTNGRDYCRLYASPLNIFGVFTSSSSGRCGKREAYIHRVRSENGLYFEIRSDSTISYRVCDVV